MSWALALALAAVATAGCGNDVDDAGAEWPRRDLKIMAPADPGGGWDTTAREMARVIEQDDLVGRNAEVYNVSGAGGTIGLAQLAAKRKGEANQMMVMGLVMLGFVDRPFSVIVLAIALLAFVIPALPGLIARLRGERFEGKKIVFGEEDWRTRSTLQLPMAAEQQPQAGWLERRREAKRIEAEREGDTAEKLAERERQPPGSSSKDNAAQACLGITVNTLPQ